MFSLVRTRAGIARSCLSSTSLVPRRTGLGHTRPYYEEPNAARKPVTRARRSFTPAHKRTALSAPTARAVDMAHELVSHGAPKPDKPFSSFSNEALNNWIRLALQTTDPPATPGQYSLAKKLIAKGVPGAQLREGMSYHEMAEWLDTVKDATGIWFHEMTKPPAAMREALASVGALKRAAQFAASSGLTPPYNEANASVADVTDFIEACHNELLKQGKPAYLAREENRDATPTEGQKKWLKRNGVELPESATRGEASDKITEMQKEILVKLAQPKGESGGETASGAIETSVQSEVVDGSAEVVVEESVGGEAVEGSVEGEVVEVSVEVEVEESDAVQGSVEGDAVEQSAEGAAVEESEQPESTDGIVHGEPVEESVPEEPVDGSVQGEPAEESGKDEPADGSAGERPSWWGRLTDKSN
ncbi:hypothetical protein CALVIDRAFT_538113 [Calocera viscosa TUFC12733]|uniref:Uncharacterized protein n=1 Tax=Calocera viscosa (strain TUFC12733) TaxID=1330018 RepID=A0A167L4S3_CALVF|nr:hypothetical protein CALVIDRAFT_538113 [Calocera viscosa TUFC12733]